MQPVLDEFEVAVDEVAALVAVDDAELPDDVVLDVVDVVAVSLPPPPHPGNRTAPPMPASKLSTRRRSRDCHAICSANADKSRCNPWSCSCIRVKECRDEVCMMNS